MKGRERRIGREDGKEGERKEVQKEKEEKRKMKKIFHGYRKCVRVSACIGVCVCEKEIVSSGGEKQAKVIKTM